MGDLDSIPVLTGISPETKAKIYKHIFAQLLPAGSLLTAQSHDSDMVFIIVEGCCRLHDAGNLTSQSFPAAGHVIGACTTHHSVTLASKGAVLAFPKSLLKANNILDHFILYEYPYSEYPCKRKDLFPPDLHIVAKLLTPMSVENCLDLGAGGGRFTLQLLDHSRTLKLVDLDGTSLKKAGEMLDWLGHNDRYTLVEGDICNLPFENDSFDLVAARLSLHEITDTLAVLKEIKRVCKKGAYILLVDVSPPENEQGRALFDQLEETLATTAIQSYTPEQWEKLLHSNKFTVKSNHSTQIQRSLSSRPNANLRGKACLDILRNATVSAQTALGVEWENGEPSWIDSRTVLLAQNID